jgi:hypothetical protein
VREGQQRTKNRLFFLRCEKVTVINQAISLLILVVGRSVRYSCLNLSICKLYIVTICIIACSVVLDDRLLQLKLVLLLVLGEEMLGHDHRPPVFLCSGLVVYYYYWLILFWSVWKLIEK